VSAGRATIRLTKVGSIATPTRKRKQNMSSWSDSVGYFIRTEQSSPKNGGIAVATPSFRRDRSVKRTPLRINKKKTSRYPCGEDEGKNESESSRPRAIALPQHSKKENVTRVVPRIDREEERGSQSLKGKLMELTTMIVQQREPRFQSCSEA